MGNGHQVSTKPNRAQLRVPNCCGPFNSIPINTQHNALPQTILNSRFILQSVHHSSCDSIQFDLRRTSRLRVHGCVCVYCVWSCQYINKYNQPTTFDSEFPQHPYGICAQWKCVCVWVAYECDNTSDAFPAYSTIIQVTSFKNHRIQHQRRNKLRWHEVEKRSMW